PVEFRIAPELVEILLLGDERAELGVDLEGRREGAEGLRGVAGQAPVTGEVILQQGVVGMLAEGPLERVDRLREAIGPLVAPSQGECHPRVARAQGGGDLEGLDGLAMAIEAAKGFPLEEATLELHA